MAVEIIAKPRPKIPYEHPDTSMYIRTFKENLIRLAVKKRKFNKHDDEICQLFQSDGANLKHMCDRLVAYVAEAFSHYAVWDYTHAYYPGRPSQQTTRVDALEGVSRVIPTLAAWLNGNTKNSHRLETLSGTIIDVAELLQTAFLAGTDPNHKGFWGNLHDYDQRICESADLALALWLSKEWVWDKFTDEQRNQVVTWFKQVNDCETVDNNWHLFPLTVQFVIKDLTGEDLICPIKYKRIKEFYVGDGWFRDGAKGNYDYYNAWGFHYSLYWIDQIEPGFDPVFIREAMASFVRKYRYFFTDEGLPLFGRSACYRLAAAAPLIAAVDHGRGGISIGQVKRAFSTSLKYFISNGALKSGSPTQGVFSDDTRLVDNYSGPASSFWSLRALNIALFCGERTGFWEAEEEPLEIEKGDFSFEIKAIEAKVIGVNKTNEVVVVFKSDYTKQQTPISRCLAKQSLPGKIYELVLGRAKRPKNNLLRKGVTCYSSKMFHFF